MGELKLHPRVTILVGENGSGKSTLIEAIAVLAGLNAEGGSKNHSFATRSTESRLHNYLQMKRGPDREKDSFFLRAESLYNVVTNLEETMVGFGWYGGETLHNRSHGESFLAIAEHRFRGKGFYIMDEPESALSPRRQLQMLQLIHEHVVSRNSQFLIATHSPILMAYPDATIYQLDNNGIEPIAYEDTEHFKTTRDFVSNPEVFLHHLMG